MLPRLLLPPRQSQRLYHLPSLSATTPASTTRCTPIGPSTSKPGIRHGPTTSRTVTPSRRTCASPPPSLSLFELSEERLVLREHKRKNLYALIAEVASWFVAGEQSRNSSEAKAFARWAEEDGTPLDEVPEWSFGNIQLAKWSFMEVKEREEMFRKGISYAVVAHGVHSSSRLQCPDFTTKPLCAGDGSAFLLLLYKILPEAEADCAKFVAQAPSQRLSPR